MKKLLLGLVLLAACHKIEKTEPKRPAPTKEADDLWALAPPGTKLGVVITSRGVRMVEHGWQDIHAFVKNAPELAPYSAMLDGALAPVGGDLSMAAFGLTSDRGAAMFMTDDNHGVMIIPVVDRDRFLQKTGGKKGSAVDTIERDLVCKPVRDLYECGDSEQAISRIGTAPQAPHLDTRGDVEMFEDGFPGFSGSRLSMVLQLDRGSVVFRGWLDGVAPTLLKVMGVKTQPTFDRDHTAGFLSFNLEQVKDLAPPFPIVEGVTAASLLQSLVGPVMVTAPAGQLGIDVQIPLVDPAPATSLVAHCTDLLPDALGATAKGGTCTIPLPLQGTELAAWVDGQTLRMGIKNLPKPEHVALTSIGAELANGTWGTAIWGRGTLFAAPVPKMLTAFKSVGDLPLVLRVGSTLSEMGLATRVDGDKLSFVASVRTIWSNRDDVVAKLTALPMSAVIAGDGAARVRELAGTGTPLAGDLQAGFVGLGLPAALIGGYIVPAVVDSMKPRRRIETEENFETLSAALERVHAATGSFPVGDTGMTPPASCCKGPHFKCDAGPKAWATGPWKALSFELTEPALFQYRYHSDGKTAEVEAVGDLDCDGIEITYRLKSSVGADGKPVFDVQSPPPNTD